MRKPYRFFVAQRCLDCGRLMPAGTWIIDSSFGVVHWGPCPDPLYDEDTHVMAETHAQMLAYRFMLGIPGDDSLERAICDTDTPIETVVALAEAGASL